MTELESIAAAVAKALGLETFSTDDYPNAGWIYKEEILWGDGSNLFYPYWQVRCRDWILSKGYIVLFDCSGGADHDCWSAATGNHPMVPDVPKCQASEFCARAIAKLMEDK